MDYNIILVGFVISLGVVGIAVVIIDIHDTSVDESKMERLQHNILMNETCPQLQDSINFMDGSNEGHWLKQYDTSPEQQRMKDLNCK